MALSDELQVEGIHAWMVADTFAIGAYRVPVGRAADEHDEVEERYCLGLGDTQCEVTVEGEGSALAGPDIIRFHKPGDRRTSMHERLMSLRLAAALTRLSDGEADLTSLALDLGFASTDHFTAAFRRRLGMPPSQFRAACAVR